MMTKFYARFPALKMMPAVWNTRHVEGTNALAASHPAQSFLDKYRKLRKAGYSDYKAFSTCEAEIAEILDRQRDDARLLRGAALAAHGDSYLDRAQRVAELESELKMQRFMRDMPKYERHQEDLEDEEGAGEHGRRRVEDLLFANGAVPDVSEYQPVMYQVVQNKAALQNRESALEIQEGFLDRTERVLRQHQQRSHIHDGLKNLSDAEVIQKVVESPTKLKRNAKAFLHLLRKHGVVLDQNGEVDHSNVKNEHVVEMLKRKEQLVKVTLMQADLEFEYPHKLERLLVRSEILAWLDEEEEKLKSLA